MKLELLKEIIKKKENRSEFAIITDLETGNSEIFESNIAISEDFKKYKDKINDFYKDKKSGVIEGTNIFIESYSRPVRVFIVGAVNIAQYLFDYIKNLNFEIIVIDPRGYFAGRQRFSGIKIINKWPNEAFKKINTDSSAALITLTHDTKIDDPALQHALKKNFYYIGALGSKKTHTSRCERLKLAGFNEDKIKLIHGPIGINLGGKSASEIALSIAAQLVAETHKKWIY